MTQTLDRDPATSPPPAPSPDERLDRIEAQAARRDGWTLTVLGIAAVLVIGAIVAVGFAARRDGSSTVAAAAGMSITAELSEFEVDVSASEVTPGSTITVVNNGSQAHTLGVTDTDLITPALQPGDTATLDLTSLGEGDYELWCDVPGHLESGMSHPLSISADATPGQSAGDMGMTEDEHANMSHEDGMAMDQVMVESMLAFPAETEGVGNQVLEATVLPDGTKHFDLTASIIDWEVSPGKIVEAWAYNGQVPGPRINLEVGDEVEITLTNELPMGTDIHWHGIDVPFDQDGVAPITQEMITAGETYTYRFTVTEPAIGMYHAHAHGDKSVPNGLLGTMYVGEIAPPAGRTISTIEIPADLEVAQDIPMVVNDAGTIGLSLNGKSFPATAPIFVNEDDWISITYFNEGMQVHPMHLHGFEQIVYAKDGEPLDQPYAADTILVGPGERYTVLFHADQVGTWVFHCHILTHVESDQGMFGMVTAVVVQ